MQYACGWLPYHCLYMLMLMTCAIMLIDIDILALMFVAH